MCTFVYVLFSYLFFGRFFGIFVLSCLEDSRVFCDFTFGVLHEEFVVDKVVQCDDAADETRYVEDQHDIIGLRGEGLDDLGDVEGRK